MSRRRQAPAGLAARNHAELTCAGDREASGGSCVRWGLKYLSIGSARLHGAPAPTRGVAMRFTRTLRRAALVVAIAVGLSVVGAAPADAQPVCASGLPAFDAGQPNYTTLPGEWDNPFP